MAQSQMAFIATTNITQVLAEINQALTSGQAMLAQKSAAIRSALQAPLLGPVGAGAGGATQANLIAAYTGQVEAATRKAATDLTAAAQPFERAIKSIAGGGTLARPGTQTFRQVSSKLEQDFEQRLNQQIESLYKGMHPALRSDPGMIAMAQDVRAKAVSSFRHMYGEMNTQLQQQATQAGLDMRRMGLLGIGAKTGLPGAVKPYDLAGINLGTGADAQLIQAQAQSSLLQGMGVGPSATRVAKNITRSTQAAAAQAADQAARDYADALQQAIYDNTNQATGQLFDPQGARRLGRGGLAQGPGGELAKFSASNQKAYEVSAANSEAEYLAAMQQRVDFLRAEGRQEGAVHARAIEAMQKRVDAMNRDAQRQGRMHQEALRMNERFNEALRKETDVRRENARYEATRRRVLQGAQAGEYRHVAGNIYEHTGTGTYRDIGAGRGARGARVSPDDNALLQRTLAREQQAIDEAAAEQRRTNRVLARRRRVLEGVAKGEYEHVSGQFYERLDRGGQRTGIFRDLSVGGQAGTVGPAEHPGLERALRRRAEAEDTLANQRRETARAEARRRRVLEGVDQGRYRNITGDYYEALDRRGRPTGMYRDISTAGGGRMADPYTDPRLHRAITQQAQRQQRQMRASQGGFFGTLMDPDARGALNAEGLGLTARTMIRYAAAGAVIGGIGMAIGDTKREAIDFRDSLTDLNVALGRGEQVSRDYVDTLESFSRLAGSNVGAALDAAARGVRAFGEAQTDTRQDLEAIGAVTAEQSNVLAVIAGKPMKDATGDLIAVASSFELQADTLGRVNEAIAGAKALGGDPNQIAQGLANGATAFRQAGFELEESAGIISVVQARLDQTGQASATRLARVFQIARGGQAQATFQALGIGSGTIREQLTALAQLREEGALTEGQLNQVIRTIGGTANTREAIVLLDNLAAVQDNVTEAMLDGGRATDEYNRKNNDLAGLFRKIAGDISNIQVNIVESGVLAPVAAMLAALEPALRLINNILNAWNQLPAIMRNSLAVTLELAAAGALLGRSFTRSANRVAEATALGDAAAIAAAQKRTLFQRAFTPVTLAGAGGGLWGSMKGARGGITEGLGKAGVTNLGSFLRTPIAMMGMAAGAITAIMAVVDVLGRLRDAAEGTAEAIEGMGDAEGVEGLQGAIRDLTEAANAQREAVGGFWGNYARGVRGGVPVADETWQQKLLRWLNTTPENLGAQLPEGESGGLWDRLEGILNWTPDWMPDWLTPDHLEEGAEDRPATDPMVIAQQLDDAARIYADILEDLEEKLLAAGDAAGVFGGFIDDLSDLEQGLAALDAAGASAVTRIEAIRAALGDFSGGEIPEGTVLPGGGAILAQELATDLHPIALDAVAEGLGGAERRRALARQEALLGTDDEEGLIARAEATSRRARTGDARERARRRAEQLREESDDLATTLEDFDAAAAEAVQNIPSMHAPDQIAASQERVAGILEGYFDEIGISASGGVLTDEQIEEAAQRMAGVLPDLSQAQREILVRAMIQNIRDRTSGSIEEMDPTLRREIQKSLLADAAKQGDILQLEGMDPIAAAREQRRTVADAESLSTLVGADVPDDVRLDALRYDRQVEDLTVARNQAIDNMWVAFGDTTGRATLDRDHAQQAVDRIVDAGRKYGEDGEYTQEYAEAYRELLDKKGELARIEVENARAARDATRDPRDDVQAALDAWQDALDDIVLATDVGERDRATAQANRLEIEARNMQRRRRQNRRRAGIDPRANVANAADELRRAEEDLAAASEDQSDYGELERNVAERRIALASAQREQAAAARRADNYPGSEMMAAADDIRDAQDAIDDALYGEAEYWDAVAQKRDAQLRYAQASREHASIMRRLAGDISDPVFMANDELRTARDNLRAAIAEGAPPDIIGQLQYEVREAEINAERVAFDERMRAAETARDLGRLSHASYLSYLEEEAARLRAIADKTYDQQRMLEEVERAMQAANEQMSGQFNLGDITVPTVYEVRRSMAAQQAGVAMEHGSTNVVNNYFDIDGADIAEVRRLLTQAVGPAASSRTTIGPRR